MPEAKMAGQVQLKNLTTRMVANQNHQHKEAFWRQVEMRNLTYTLSPHSPVRCAH